MYQGWYTESLRPLIFVQKIWLPVLQRWNRNFHGSVYQAGDRRLVCWLHDNNFVSCCAIIAGGSGKRAWIASDACARHKKLADVSMAGIYIHIPFCKQACYYCNFHFSTQLTTRDQMVAAICKDIQLRHNYLEERKLDSTLFWRWHWSILSIGQLAQIMDALKSYFVIGHDGNHPGM